MAHGFRFVWTDEDLPGGGDVVIFDDVEVYVICRRPAFNEDPHHFMGELEAVMAVNTCRVRGLRLVS
jgi:hypothetical protein